MFIEIPQKAGNNYQYHPKHNKVSVFEFQLRHKNEIHTVQTSQECDGDKNGLNDGQEVQSLIRLILQHEVIMIMKGIQSLSHFPQGIL